MPPRLRWLPAVAWMAIIFVVSAQPHLRIADETGLDFAARKLGHLVAFGALGVLLFEALGGPRRRHATLVAFWLTVLYAVTDEIHQAFVAGRGPAASDVIIDAIGAAVALLAWTRAVRPSLRMRLAG